MYVARVFMACSPELCANRSCVKLFPDNLQNLRIRRAKNERSYCTLRDDRVLTDVRWCHLFSVMCISISCDEVTELERAHACAGDITHVCTRVNLAIYIQQTWRKKRKKPHQLVEVHFTYKGSRESTLYRRQCGIVTFTLWFFRLWHVS